MDVGDEQAAQRVADEIRTQAATGPRQEVKINVGTVFNGPVAVSGDLVIGSD